MKGAPEAFGSGYRLLSAAVVPRPIAWVASRNGAGDANLAPFSFYNVVTPEPPTVMFSTSGVGADRKDTARNVAETGECVVHVVTRELAASMNATSATLPYGESEFAHADLETAPCEVVDVRRVSAAAVAFECTLHEAVEIGASTVLLVEVEYAHVDDELLTDGRLDVRRLDAVGRLAGGYYATLDDRFEMARPD